MTCTAVNQLLDIFAEPLRGSAAPIDELVDSLTDDEMLDVQNLAARIIKNGAGGRSDMKVVTDCLNGKLGEYMLFRRFQKLGIPVVQNFETITLEKYWDLKVTLDGIEYVLEVKRQARRSESANFTRPPTVETMCQQWRNIDLVVMWVPDGKMVVPWFIMDAAALDPERKMMQPLTHRPGFCLPVQPLVDADLALVIEP